MNEEFKQPSALEQFLCAWVKTPNGWVFQPCIQDAQGGDKEDVGVSNCSITGNTHHSLPRELAERMIDLDHGCCMDGVTLYEDCTEELRSLLNGGRP